MQNEFQERRQKNLGTMRAVYNISVAVIILTVGFVMLFLNVINNETLNGYLGYIDPLLRYMFGGLCLIYGIFRLYRGLKKQI